MFPACCSVGSQLFCAKIYRNGSRRICFIRPRVRVKSTERIPITTLTESTLCSKIETHRRQIKTRKKKSNEKSCTNRLLCRTSDCVCAYMWLREIDSQAENVFMAQGHRLLDFVWLCWFAHSRHTFNRFQFTPRLPRHFSSQLFSVSFPDFHRLLHPEQRKRKRFSTAIFQALSFHVNP